jgi:hypothetical protein
MGNGFQGNRGREEPRSRRIEIEEVGIEGNRGREEPRSRRIEIEEVGIEGNRDRWKPESMEGIEATAVIHSWSQMSFGLTLRAPPRYASGPPSSSACGPKIDPYLEAVYPHLTTVAPRSDTAKRPVFIGAEGSGASTDLYLNLRPRWH